MSGLATIDKIESGLKIEAGLVAIAWSHLAKWDKYHLVAETNQDAFNSYWPNIDPKYGRWLCWLAFGVGAESIVKGAFQLKTGNPLGPFGGSHPWKRLGMPNKHIAFVSDGILKLAKEVRNRDAHEYVPERRAADFPDIEQRYVPALNHIFDCIGPEVLSEVASLPEGANPEPAA